MSRRTIFCEGPDDLAALREVATRLLGATVLHGMPTGGASLERIASSESSSVSRGEPYQRKSSRSSFVYSKAFMPCQADVQPGRRRFMSCAH